MKFGDDACGLRREIARPGGVVAEGKGEGRERGNRGTYSLIHLGLNVREVSGAWGITAGFRFPGSEEGGGIWGRRN
jgi:hypothetical protein